MEEVLGPLSIESPARFHEGGDRPAVPAAISHDDGHDVERKYPVAVYLKQSVGTLFLAVESAICLPVYRLLSQDGPSL